MSLIPIRKPTTAVLPASNVDGESIDDDPFAQFYNESSPTPSVVLKSSLKPTGKRALKTSISTFATSFSSDDEDSANKPSEAKHDIVYNSQVFFIVMVLMLMTLVGQSYFGFC